MPKPKRTWLAHWKGSVGTGFSRDRVDVHLRLDREPDRRLVLTMSRQEARGLADTLTSHLRATGGE